MPTNVVDVHIRCISRIREINIAEPDPAETYQFTARFLVGNCRNLIVVDEEIPVQTVDVASQAISVIGIRGIHGNRRLADERIRLLQSHFIRGQHQGHVTECVIGDELKPVLLAVGQHFNACLEGKSRHIGPASRTVEHRVCIALKSGGTVGLRSEGASTSDSPT